MKEENILKMIFPNYYKDFKCIADKCKHSCCVGWEIDVDDDTLNYYNSLDGDFALKIKNSISKDSEPHFILQDGKRCPHLDKNGLCSIITNLGEDALCDICFDHPRFRNFYFDTFEIGLGLCCEAAAELILTSDKKFELENFDLSKDFYTNEEMEILSLRSELFDIMKRRELSIELRHKKLLEKLNCKLPEKSMSEWCDFYMSLEILDENWKNHLQNLKISTLENIYEIENEKTKISFEQLTIYFIYRHFSSVPSISEAKKFLCFAILSTKIIMALYALDSSEDSLLDFARMYSAEIEYSDENIEKICREF